MSNGTNSSGVGKGGGAAARSEATPAFSDGYQKFMALSDDEKALAIVKARNTKVDPPLNEQSKFQRVLAGLGIEDKPGIVSEEEFAKLDGPIQYRTVQGIADSETGEWKMTAVDIAKQNMEGTTTRVSYDGLSHYGDGVYFTDDVRDSLQYGHGMDIEESCVMQAKLNKNAKIINYDDALAGLNNEIKQKTKLGKALPYTNNDEKQSAVSLYAMAKGYNVIYSGNKEVDNGGGPVRESHYNVLNRSALTFNATVRSHYDVQEEEWKKMHP